VGPEVHDRAEDPHGNRRYEETRHLFFERLLISQGLDPIEELVRDGRRMEFIRPSRRTVNHAPHIDITDYLPPPPDLKTKRKPRYAGKGA